MGDYSQSDFAASLLHWQKEMDRSATALLAESTLHGSEELKEALEASHGIIAELKGRLGEMETGSEHVIHVYRVSRRYAVQISGGTEEDAIREALEMVRNPEGGGPLMVDSGCSFVAVPSLVEATA